MALPLKCGAGTCKIRFSHLPKVSARPLTPSEPSSAPKSLMLTERDHRKVRLCSGIDWLCLDLHVVLKNSSITSIKTYKKTFINHMSAQDTYDTFMMIDPVQLHSLLNNLAKYILQYPTKCIQKDSFLWQKKFINKCISQAKTFAEPVILILYSKSLFHLVERHD